MKRTPRSTMRLAKRQLRAQVSYVCKLGSDPRQLFFGSGRPTPYISRICCGSPDKSINSGAALDLSYVTLADHGGIGVDATSAGATAVTIDHCVIYGNRNGGTGDDCAGGALDLTGVDPSRVSYSDVGCPDLSATPGIVSVSPERFERSQPGMARASPKSKIFKPWSVRKMLDGFRSRWTMS